MEYHDLHYKGEGFRTACKRSDSDEYITDNPDSVTCPECRKITFSGFVTGSVLTRIKTEEVKVTRTRMELNHEDLRRMLMAYLPEMFKTLDGGTWTMKFFVNGNGYWENIDIDDQDRLQVLIERTERTEA